MKGERLEGVAEQKLRRFADLHSYFHSYFGTFGDRESARNLEAEGVNEDGAGEGNRTLVTGRVV